MEQKKRKIAHRAHNLFITQGIVDTSLQDILDAASISKGTFYKYFESKDACLQLIIEEKFNDIFSNLETVIVGDDEKDIHSFERQVECYLELLDRYHLYELNRAVRQSPHDELRSFMFEKERNIIRFFAHRYQTCRPTVPLVYCFEISALFYSMMQTLVIYYTRKKVTMPTRKASKMLTEYADMIAMRMINTKETLFLQELNARQLALLEIVEEIEQLRKDAKKGDYALLDAMVDQLSKPSPPSFVLLTLCKGLEMNHATLLEKINVYDQLPPDEELL